MKKTFCDLCKKQIIHKYVDIKKDKYKYPFIKYEGNGEIQAEFENFSISIKCLTHDKFSYIEYTPDICIDCFKDIIKNVLVLED